MKKFATNFFITGISWLIYNTFFFFIYAVFCMIRHASEDFGGNITNLAGLNEYKIMLAMFSILLIVFFVGFFFIGKKTLLKYQNPVLAFLSCFSSYAFIAFAILRSNTLLAFTRFYLDVLFTVILTKPQDFYPPLTDAEYVPWAAEVWDRQVLVMDLKTSGLLNALFALLPFIIAFIGLCMRKEQIKTENQKTVLSTDES